MRLFSQSEAEPKTTSKRVLLLVSLLCALWGARSCFPLIGPNSPRITKYDLDCHWLMSGIEPTQSFVGTLRWWTGPWCCDFVPYYRPMTSLFFWLEYKAFGSMGLQGFTAVHLLSHLILVSICALFLAELLGLRRALIGMVFWCLGFPKFLSLGDPNTAFPVWKDSCDIWCGICYLSSAWLFLRYLRTGRKQCLVTSLIAFVLAITFKEMAYTLPILLLLILWYEKRIRSDWRLVVPYFCIAACAVLYRFWALQGPGFRNGTNGAWWHRTIVDLLGAPALPIVNNDSFPLAVLALIVAVFLARSPSHRRAAIKVGGVSLFLLGLTCYQTRIPVQDLVFRLILPEFWSQLPYIGVCIFLTMRFILGKRREQWFGYGWVVITHIPLMSMPVGEHGFYMVAIGWSLWLTEALDDLLLLAKEQFPSFKRWNLPALNAPRLDS